MNAHAPPAIMPPIITIITTIIAIVITLEPSIIASTTYPSGRASTR